MNDPPNDTDSPADILLRYLWVRRTGSGTQFRKAVEYCFGCKEKHVVIARRLCALGHVEFDWDGPDLRWRVVPPSFFRLNGKLGLCGVLPRDEEERFVGAGLLTERVYEEFGESVILRRFVVDPNGSAARTLKSPEFMYSVAHQAYFDLLQRLPSLRTLLARRVSAVLPEVALRFNLTTRQFDQEVLEPNPGDGLLKEIGYGKSRYYYEGKEVDLTSGLWLALSAERNHVARCSADELDLPRFPELPPLFERVLYFAGARRETTGGRVKYRNVDHGIAPRIVAKLGMRAEDIPA